MGCVIFFKRISQCIVNSQLSLSIEVCNSGDDWRRLEDGKKRKECWTRRRFGDRLSKKIKEVNGSKRSNPDMGYTNKERSFYVYFILIIIIVENQINLNN